MNAGYNLPARPAVCLGISEIVAAEEKLARNLAPPPAVDVLFPRLASPPQNSKVKLHRSPQIPLSVRVKLAPKREDVSLLKVVEHGTGLISPDQLWRIKLYG